MTLQQLKYAIAVSDCKSINQAARKFYLTQPALSGAIRELEEEIGMTLFERTNRGVYVTAEGTDFSLTTKPLDKATGSSPQTLAISSTFILYEGTYAPYPTIPTIKSP